MKELIVGKSGAMGIICLVLCLNPGFVIAQEEETSFEVTVKGIALDRSVMDLWIETTDGYESFPVSKSRISRPFEISTVGEVFLYVQSGETESGEPIFQPVGRAQVTPDYEEYLLILHSLDSSVENDGLSQRRYAMLPVGRDLDFSAGTVEFLNFSSYPVACRLNDSDFSLERGESERFTQTDNEAVTVGLRVAKRTDDGWKIGFNSVWRHRADFRTLILITDHPRREGAITAKRLYDEVASEN